jgi:hypothetical protein
MDETTNGISVNTNLTNGAGTNSYENTLKKLIHILKLKSNDKLNQLEKLWESINVVSTTVGSASPPSSLNNKSPPYARTSPTNESNSTTSIKRDSSKISDSSLETTTSIKRLKTNETDNSKTILNKPLAKPISALTKSSTSTSLIAKNVNNINNNVKYSPNTNLNSKCKSPTNSETSNEPPTESSSLSKTNNQPVKMDLNNDVVDLLDFTCSICKLVFFRLIFFIIFYSYN